MNTPKPKGVSLSMSKYLTPCRTTGLKRKSFSPLSASSILGSKVVSVTTPNSKRTHVGKLSSSERCGSTPGNEPMKPEPEVKELVNLEKPEVEELVDLQKPPIKELVNLENPAVKELVHLENPAVKELVLVEKPAVKELVLVEKPAAKELVHLEKPAFKELVHLKKPEVNELFHLEKPEVNELFHSEKPPVKELLYLEKPAVNELVNLEKPTCVEKLNSPNNPQSNLYENEQITMKEEDNQPFVGFINSQDIIQLINYINLLGNEVKQKRQLSEAYKKQHNLSELQETTEVWKNAFQEAVVEIQDILRSRGADVTLANILKENGIPLEDAGFNEETINFE